MAKIAKMHKISDDFTKFMQQQHIANLKTGSNKDKKTDKKQAKPQSIMQENESKADDEEFENEMGDMDDDTASFIHELFRFEEDEHEEHQAQPLQLMNQNVQALSTQSANTTTTKGALNIKGK